MEASTDTLYSPVKPCFNEFLVVNLCRRLYGITPADIVELNGYDDQNFLIKKASIIGSNKHLAEISADGYVFKITNSKESENKELIDAQVKVLLHLGQHNISAPTPVPNIKGLYYSLERIEGEDQVSNGHIIRLLEFRRGEMLLHVPVDEPLAQHLGAFLYNLDNCLKLFDHPAFKDRDLLFMLEKIPTLRHFLFVIKDGDNEALVVDSIKRFEKEVLTKIDELEKGIIHGDFNEQNIVIRDNNVSAVLDFGDCHYGPYIFEVSVALAYLLMLTCDIKLCQYFLRGYTAKKPFTALEESVLSICVRARICQSLVLGLYAHAQNPENEYVLSTQKAGWKILAVLCSKSDDFLLAAYP